jgi:hypothetical protein
MFCCFLVLSLVLVNIFLRCFVGYFPLIVSDASVILQINNVMFKNVVTKDQCYLLSNVH